MSLHRKETIKALRLQWKRLWRERVDDKVRAEGVATTNYYDLFIEQGTIIHATRNFKAVNFKEILEQHQIENAERYVPPDPRIGGWNKFIKTNITIQQSRRKRRSEFYCRERNLGNQQPKKNGRGWLHK